MSDTEKDLIQAIEIVLCGEFGSLKLAMAWYQKNPHNGYWSTVIKALKKAKGEM